MLWIQPLVLQILIYTDAEPYAQCRFDECRYGECRGAIKSTKLLWHISKLKANKQKYNLTQVNEHFSEQTQPNLVR